MLISFSFSNWMSFRETTSLSMIASRERQHGERIPRIRKYQTRVLPIASLYGGNASGKTNMVRALDFARTLILHGPRPDRPIPVQSFQLNAQSRDQPSSFQFELLVDEFIYAYDFTVSQERVWKERLVKCKSTREQVLYDRSQSSVKFHSSLQDHPFLEFVFRGTRPNQLLLTNAISQNVEGLRPVYNWFAKSLILIAPDDRFVSVEPFLDEGNLLHTKMGDILGRLDTGITRLSGKDVSWENMPFPKSFADLLEENLNEGETMMLLGPSGFAVTLRHGELVAIALKTVHAGDDGTEAEFDIEQEADGSKRVIELLPAFLSLSAKGSEKILVIDEIDRSLHSLLTRKLVETYLSTCNEDSRSQLLLTTHDLLLMDQKLLRRDEMWLASRDSGGVSHLKSLGDFKDTRYDKDVRKSYLQGRMGGIPRLLLEGEDLHSPPEPIQANGSLP